MSIRPLSRSVTLTVSSSSEVSTTFLGTLTMRTGISTSFSYVSLRVIISQKTPDNARKNKKVRNSLFTELNRKLLTSCFMSRRLSIYFVICELVGSLNM